MVLKAPLVHKASLALPVQTDRMESTVHKVPLVHKALKVLPDQEVVTIKI